MNPEAITRRILAALAAGEIKAEAALPIINELSQGSPADEALAVVGLAIRFPDADSPGRLWDHLVNGRNLVRTYPSDRFDLVVNATPALAQKYGSRKAECRETPAAQAAWLSGIEQFEPEAFGLSAHEAQFMGPAERIFLQVSAEALAQAGYTRPELNGSRTGVFVAHSPYPAFDYLRLFAEQDERAYVSNIPANLGYHLAYALDLRGPVLTVNTACSSGLSAVHTAKNALRQGDCDIAVVGGVNLVLFPFWDDAPDHVVRSPKFRCASYDADADGIIGGEGIAVLVLKRLSDALRDHDHVHVVIKGSGMSSDGTSNGMQAPNPDAQAQAVLAALNDAHVSADSIQYVEGHGAGTPLGDLIEVDGLTKAFRQHTSATGFCRLGAIKSNIGHLGDAAGLAGLIKVILSLQHKLIPGMAHFRQANPKIGFERTPFLAAGENAAWVVPAGNQPRRGGVSSIGISGTNVHVVVEEFVREASGTPVERPIPVFLSAPSRWALWELVHSFAQELDMNRHWALQDIVYTLNTRRAFEQARVGIFAASTAELLEKLERLLQVRTFERVPDGFYAQGIFLADEAETRTQSLALFHRCALPAAAEDVALMRRFVEGEQFRAAAAARYGAGVVLPLPTPPFRTRRIWPAAEGNVQRDVSDLFFETRWVPCAPAETPVEQPTAVEPGSLWLLLARPEDAVLPGVRARLRAAGARTVMVSTGAGFARLGADDFTIAPTEEGAFERLFAALGHDALASLRGIVHGTTLKPADETMETWKGVESAQNEGAFSLFALIKAILAHGLTHPFQLTVASSMVEPVTPADQAIPARVTLFGLAKVFSQENPTVSSFAVDHDLSGTPDAVAAQIFAELTGYTGTRRELVAYRAGQRLTKLVERQPDQPAQAIPIRNGGTYVVAGGTGYLGMQVSRFLSERAKVNILLLARRPLPDRSQWDRILADKGAHDEMLVYKLSEIRAAEQRGSHVEIMQCDVTDPESVARTFAEIRNKYGAIHGAFMLVKQLYHLWLKELTFTQFQTGIFNRVKGTWLVERAIRSPALDFFILFSSISSLMGTKSASECCSVNQFLDAMGAHLTGLGRKAHVLNLTLILDDKRDFGAKTPIPPIDFVDLQNALSRFFRNGHGWSLVSRFDLDEVNFLKPVLKIPFGPQFWQEVDAHVQRKGQAAPMAGAPEADTVPDVLDAAEIQRRMEKVWKTVLGLDDMQGGSNFFTCGGTSLSALRFVQLFRRNFPGVPFELADLYSMPTLQAQLDHCERALCPKDAMSELFDALENDTISTEDAVELLKKSLGAR